MVNSTILATLFGFGFSIQLGRAADDATAVDIYSRRLAVLAGIGLGHALLLRNGDILLPYSLTGFLMIPFRKARDRTILIAAFAAFLIPAAAGILSKSFGIAIPDRPQLENAPFLVENAAWVRFWYQTAIFTWPTNLTLFLFGLLLGRHQILDKIRERPRTLMTILLCGLGAGTVLFFIDQALVHARWAGIGSVTGLIFTLHCWGMSSAYVAAFLLALRTSAGERILMPLSAIGRMPLTNYLSQAAIIVPLCLLFGWFDHFTPTRSLDLTLVLFAFVQFPFSLVWLRHFEFGPAEWAWRKLTYGRVPSLKRAIAVERA
jgi:Predicted membrane protein